MALRHELAKALLQVASLPMTAEWRVRSSFSGRQCDSLQPKLAFGTAQNETGEANTPSCPQEHGCDEHELSKLLNFSQNNGYHEALDELFLPVSKRNCLGSNIIWLDRKLWSKTGQMALTQLFPVSYASLMKQ